MTPEQWHRFKAHRQPFETCWYCGRERAVCRAKDRYETREDVDVAVEEINSRQQYAEPVMRYPCRWCNGYHVAHARSARAQKRAVKASRKAARTS
jgi:hypothetical protein